MIEVVWTIIQHRNRFLLTQRSTTDTAGGTWVFPGGKVDTKDKSPVDAAIRELKEEVGLDGERFKELGITCFGQYRIQIFYCQQWSGTPKPSCDDIIGVGWFTLAEIHTLNRSLAPFLNKSLMYLSYLIQHCDSHPDEWCKHG